MTELLLQPFEYNYMVKAIWVSGIVGAVCAFLSAYLMLKGWSLMGDALSHSVVPGVAGAYALGFPYSVGAFFTGMLAALSMTFVRHLTRLREDAVIGFIFSTFFAAGLLIVSLNPTSVNVQTIIMGNILGIADEDMLQVEIIIAVSFLVLMFIWKDLLVVFFDETHARSIGLNPLGYLANDYGFQEVYLWPINAEEQGTPQQVRHMIDTVREYKIPVVFSESTISDKPAKQVAKETGAEYGGVLYVDSLSAADGPVPTYIDLLNTTVETIAKGFHQ